MDRFCVSLEIDGSSAGTDTDTVVSRVPSPLLARMTTTAPGLEATNHSVSSSKVKVKETLPDRCRRSTRWEHGPLYQPPHACNSSGVDVIGIDADPWMSLIPPVVCHTMTCCRGVVGWSLLVHIPNRPFA